MRTVYRSVNNHSEGRSYIIAVISQKIIALLRIVVRDNILLACPMLQLLKSCLLLGRSCFAVCESFPGVGTHKMSKCPGVGTKKEAKCPAPGIVALQHLCNFFYWSVNKTFNCSIRTAVKAISKPFNNNKLKSGSLFKLCWDCGGRAPSREWW